MNIAVGKTLGFAAHGQPRLTSLDPPQSAQTYGPETVRSRLPELNSRK